MTLTDRITRLFRKVVPVPLNNPARFYTMGGGWGLAINWWQPDKWPEGKMPKATRVYGFQPRRPRRGDVLTVGMSSGRRGVFVFTDVELKSDPHDMFFADVEWRGYEDELTMPRKEARSGCLL